VATRKVASFEIEHTRFIDEAGQALEGHLPEWARDPQALVPMYRSMVLARAFDAKAIAMQRTGQLGTYSSSLGQEAIGVAVGSTMRREDVLFPTYREQAAQLAHGVSMTELLLYWGGDERGSHFAEAPEDFPICVPIAAQSAHAVGVAFAFKRRSQPRVAVCMAGDGATSKGDLYEAMNLAGVWRLPVLFVISNNRWAISVSRERQTATETLAQKAVAAGFPGLQVDGNDVVAVRWAAEMALERARSGGGPTLIEALTYRLHDHTTADDARRYRDDEEVSAHWTLEPIARLRAYLVALEAWSRQDEEALHRECQAAVQSAVDAYLATPLEPPQAIFDHLYAELPAALVEQRNAALDEASRLEEDDHA